MPATPPQQGFTSCPAPPALVAQIPKLAQEVLKAATQATQLIGNIVQSVVNDTNIPLVPQTPSSAPLQGIAQNQPDFFPFPLQAAEARETPKRLNTGTSTTPLRTGTKKTRTNKTNTLKTETPKTDKTKKKKKVRIPEVIIRGDFDVNKCGGWEELIKAGLTTEDEKQIIVLVSGNEGRPDTVHSNSGDPAALTVGFNQKTIQPYSGKQAAYDGSGEFPTQVYQFLYGVPGSKPPQPPNPEKYKQFFEDNGYTVFRPSKIDKKTGKTVFTGPPKIFLDPRVIQPPGVVLPPQYQQKITGTQLRNFFQYLRNTYGKAGFLPYLQPISEAGKDPDFQRKQIIDAVNRLHGALNKAGSYKPLTPELKALLLDQDINAPSNVKSDFAKALKAVGPVPKSTDPKVLLAFEQKLIAYYGPNRRQTNPVGRARNIHNFYYPPPKKKAAPQGKGKTGKKSGAKLA